MKTFFVYFVWVFCIEIDNSILDERLYQLKFASVYAVIKDINYLESWNMMNCPWCDPPNCIERPECDSSPQKSHQDASDQKWSSLVPKLNFKNEDMIHFPQLKDSSHQNKASGFGIRGKILHRYVKSNV